MTEYAEAAQGAETDYQVSNLYSNAQLAAAISQSGAGAPYVLATAKRNAAPRPVIDTTRIGGAGLQNVATGGVTIMGHFVPYTYLGLGVAALVGAYFVFGKKKRGRRR